MAGLETFLYYSVQGDEIVCKIRWGHLLVGTGDVLPFLLLRSPKIKCDRNRYHTIPCHTIPYTGVYVTVV